MRACDQEGRVCPGVVRAEGAGAPGKGDEDAREPEHLEGVPAHAGSANSRAILSTTFTCSPRNGGSYRNRGVDGVVLRAKLSIHDIKQAGGRQRLDVGVDVAVVTPK